MGLSFGGLIGGDSGDTSSNTTQNYDQSNRAAVTSQSGVSTQGSNNTINDSSLVSIGLENNKIAGDILSHIADTTTATIGKLADVVKTTSNDTLTSAISNSANAAQNTTAANTLFSSLGNNIQNLVLVGAALLGAWYLLGRPKG